MLPDTPKSKLSTCISMPILVNGQARTDSEQNPYCQDTMRDGVIGRRIAMRLWRNMRSRTVPFANAEVCYENGIRQRADARFEKGRGVVDTPLPPSLEPTIAAPHVFRMWEPKVTKSLAVAMVGLYGAGYGVGLFKNVPTQAVQLLAQGATSTTSSVTAYTMTNTMGGKPFDLRPAVDTRRQSAAISPSSSTSDSGPLVNT